MLDKGLDKALDQTRDEVLDKVLDKDALCIPSPQSSPLVEGERRADTAVRPYRNGSTHWGGQKEAR